MVSRMPANALTGVRAVVIEHYGFARMASCFNLGICFFVKDGAKVGVPIYPVNAYQTSGRGGKTELFPFFLVFPRKKMEKRSLTGPRE